MQSIEPGPESQETAPDSATLESEVIDPADFVTVARFYYPTEAHILCGHLEAEGIPAYVPDAHMGGGNAFLFSGTGGMRVQVPAHLAARAEELIREWREGKHALPGEASEAAAELTQERALEAYAQDQVWLQSWRGLMAGTSRWAGFNPFVAVLGINWFFYRKMYGWGLATMAADFVIGTSFGFVAMLLCVRLPAGLLANYLYYRKALAEVRRVQAAGLLPEDAMKMLKARGGVSFGATLGALAIMYLSGLFL